jgi:hypothetical protein
MATAEKKPEISPELREILDQTICLLYNHIAAAGSLAYAKHIHNALKQLIDYQKKLEAATSDASTFASMAELERLMTDLRVKLNDVNFRSLLDKMSKLEVEAEIVSQKKNEYLQLHGVKLRNHCRSKTSVMTLSGRVIYERMELIPSRACDKAKLKELGVGYVYPLDEALRLSSLPFKMTLGTMLEIAKWSSRSESYQEAEDIIREYTRIEVNDDTMRQVTNTIGTIVFENDVMAAEKAWDDLNNRRLVFGKPTIDGVLYLECDGAMLPTRQEGQKGSVYKEAKLGMAFSSEHIRKWIDEHGEPQHSIEKKEFTAFIGDSEAFGKLMFSLAIKNGYGKHKITVLISDGATWIRNMKDLLFPDAQQILDYYHLKEHISDYFKIIYPDNESIAKRESKHVNSLIYESKLDKAKKKLEKSSKGRDTIHLNNLFQYLQNNEKNIDYAEYMAKGYFIGSGAIESSNKIVLQRRLKYGAMRWNIPAAQAVVSLVSKYRGRLWESDVVEATHRYYDQPYTHPGKEV